MTDRPRRPKPSFAERKAQRAQVEDPVVVLDAALRFLEARARSVSEVRRRLTTAGYREDLVEGAIQRLGDLGMLDDASFATQWVESRDRARPRGERAIRSELRARGVDQATAEAALEERRESAGQGIDPDDAAADRLLERQARALARVPDLRARGQRAYALLARHGFGSATASGAIRRAMAGWSGTTGLDDEDLPRPE